MSAFIVAVIELIGTLAPVVSKMLTASKEDQIQLVADAKAAVQKFVQTVADLEARVEADTAAALAEAAAKDAAAQPAPTPEPPPPISEPEKAQ